MYVEKFLETDWLRAVQIFSQRVKKWAVCKSGTGTRGRGHWDACVGTWDWGRETRDLRTSNMGRGDV